MDNNTYTSIQGYEYPDIYIYFDECADNSKVGIYADYTYLLNPIQLHESLVTLNSQKTFIYKYCGEDTFIIFDKGLDYITHCELLKCYNIASFCDEYDAISSIYQKLLYFGVITWRNKSYGRDWNSWNILYNKLKSPAIEKYIQGIRHDAQYINIVCRIPIKHLLKYIYGESFFTDELDNLYMVENDFLRIVPHSRKSLIIDVAGFSEWVDSKNMMNMRKWVEQGMMIMEHIRSLLPLDTDLWIMSELDDATSEWGPKLIMTQQKSKKQDDNNE